MLTNCICDTFQTLLIYGNKNMLEEKQTYESIQVSYESTQINECIDTSDFVSMHTVLKLISEN